MRTKVDVEEMASGRSPQWEICMGLYGADWCFLIKYLASPSCPTPDHSICKFRYEKTVFFAQTYFPLLDLPVVVAVRNTPAPWRHNGGVRVFTAWVFLKVWSTLRSTPKWC